MRHDTLFDLAPEWPDGFRFAAEVITPAEEAALIEAMTGLPFRNVVMRGVPSKRRIVQFGHYYSFQSRALTPADPIPDYLLELRRQVAPIAAVAPGELSEALVTEYAPGAAIGWHRDAPPFGVIIGVSLAGQCTMRMKRMAPPQGKPIAIDLPPRSVYVFSGPARADWLHSIPPTRALRYSITYRTVR